MLPKILAIILGPYRNLSTLTSACLAFHPNVQVLNHAGERLLRDARIDFIASPMSMVLQAFLETALRESEGGRRGIHGGSILHSHAFDDPAMRSAFKARYGDSRSKACPHCLVWKDSVTVQKRLMSENGRLAATIAALPELRFILPIRQPLDCAQSNMRTGHARYLLPDAEEATLPMVLDAVLDAIRWVLQQRERWPQRFFVFTEHAVPVDLARSLAAHLALPVDERWFADFGLFFRPRDRKHPRQLAQLEQDRITERLAEWPDIRDALLA